MRKKFFQLNTVALCGEKKPNKLCAMLIWMINDACITLEANG